MAQPHEKLATSLGVLKAVQTGGRRVFQSNEIRRTHRERLIKTGFLQEVMKGWVISKGTDASAGDSTPWYASFWEFCYRYSRKRFGDDWHLSPEQSLMLHAGNTVIPSQMVIYSPKGANNRTALPFNCSLYDLKEKESPQAREIDEADGIRIYTIPAALTRVQESFYQRFPLEARVVLSQISDASDLLRHLLTGGHSSVAGRLMGAFRQMGKDDIADDIGSAMKTAGYSIRERNLFEVGQSLRAVARSTAPIVARLEVLWDTHRTVVIDTFPPAPGLPDNSQRYLQAVDEIYRSDAYHSLSIEGYRVTPELIDRVQSGAWDQDRHDRDRASRDALATRGYWQAFQVVKRDVAEVNSGAIPGDLVKRSHQNWYRELFQPCVAAGIIGAEAIAGYRNDALVLRPSRHVPPRWEAVRDAMPALFDLLSREAEASVRAVLGHWLVGYIHPYPDGNGRIARFLMNVMLASGGYPWTVIRVDDRRAYLEALEAASVGSAIGPFSQFIAERVQRAPRWST